jgi:tetratricopeptide (TPR) repeat protein
MKRSTRVPLLLIRRIALLCVFTASALSQIRQIDRSRLPQNGAVQSAYSDLLPIDQFARTYEAKWRFPVPKDQVASRFLLALLTLEQAQKQDPSNKELQLFTGLVAHLAYNLDIEEAYDPAMKLLQAQASEDYRAAWFLGIHQCQSNNSVGGMQQLLHVETSATSLPGTFWQDYANCAGVTSMPVHAVRAYDNAKRAADGTPIDAQLEQIARNALKKSDPAASYPAKQAWYAQQTADHVRFTSNVCGESFTAKANSPVSINDVSKGSCTVIVTSEKYSTRDGYATASLLVLTQMPREAESLEAYSQRMLNNPRYADKTPLTGVPCPVATCLAFEIITDKLYKSEGGAHLLAVFFQSDQPAYPGLRFETPQPLPKAPSGSGQPTFFTAKETPQRFNGPLYTFVALDANQDIYPRSRNEFDDLMKSLVVDSK